MIPAKTLVAVVFMATTFIALANDAGLAAKQAELEQACEAARTEKLAPLRQKMVEVCVKKGEFDSRQECETYYSDYGERAGRHQGMFYDLPPCVEAFDYAQSERSGD